MTTTKEEVMRRILIFVRREVVKKLVTLHWDQLKGLVMDRFGDLIAEHNITGEELKEFLKDRLTV